MSVLPAPCISLNTAAVLTGRSIRTWQRRIEDGLVPRLGDERGRALVAFDAVRPALAVELAAAEVDLLVRADQGDARAQAEVGALFALAALRDATLQAALGDATATTSVDLSATYLGWLAARNDWLAGTEMSYADLSAAAQWLWLFAVALHLCLLPYVAQDLKVCRQVPCLWLYCLFPSLLLQEYYTSVPYTP